MDTNYQPLATKPETKPTNTEIEQAKEIIREACRKYSMGCFAWDVDQVNAGRVSDSAINLAKQEMKRDKLLRFKEDPYEHAHEWILKESE